MGAHKINASAKIYVGSGLRGNSPHGLPIGIDQDAFKAAVADVVRGRFAGATISKARGYYLGRFEPTVMVDVWNDDAAVPAAEFLASVRDAAKDLSRRLDQSAIAVVTPDGKGGEDVEYVGAVAARHRSRSGRWIQDRPAA